MPRIEDEVQFKAAGQMLKWVKEALCRQFRPSAKLGIRVIMVRGSLMATELARILKRHGLMIEMVDRASLLECARRTRASLILCDLSLSGISEVEDVISLRQRLPACKVLLFSGQRLRRNSLPPGCEAELVRTIERLCNDHNGHMLWLDLARFVEGMPRRRSMAA
jgi:hypothetical protein